MNYHIILERAEEIRTAIDDKDLSRATRRILDFLSDFQISPNLTAQAIKLRSDYNAYAILEKSEATETKRQELILRTLKLGELIEDELIRTIKLKGRYDDDPIDTLEELKEAYFQENPFEQTVEDKNVVFKGVGVSKTFQTSNFFFELPTLDLELRIGEITGIVGENGNGKTTLLRIIAGALQADGGELSYPYFGVKPHNIDWYFVKQRIAFITQELKPWQGLLKENLHFSASIHGIRGEENEEEVEFILHRLGLSRYEEATWNEISSGYKLRFALAKALVWHPSLLIIDEPLANLDINTQQIFLQDLRYLANSAKHPLAIIISSQHLHEVESIADNIIFIKNGEALYNGKMEDFGKNRTENIFEFTTPSTRELLETALSQLQEYQLEDNGQVLILRTPLEVSSTEILQLLCNHSIVVNYFRDISSSTLKLFRDDVYA